MNFKWLGWEEKNKIVHIILKRPDVRNAFNPEMISEITTAFQKLQTLDSVRAVVIKGEGKAFCAGADLNWMKDMVNFTLEQNKKDAGDLNAMFEAIHDCLKPVVSVVHGAVFGGALGIIGCSDIVIAEEKTQFCFSETKLGIAPAVISRFILEKIPLAFVKEHMLTAKIFLATEASKIGLVQYVEEEDNLSARLEQILSQIQECGPQALMATKKMLHAMNSLNQNEQKQLVINVISERRVSAEGQEGLKSFLEKRSPSWRKS